MKIYDFIKDGLDTFSDNGGLYDTELRDIFIELNELLNNVKNNNYEEYLRENKDKIRRNINEIFKILNSNGFLYINLKFLLDWFYKYQEEKEITREDENGIDKYRDHYFHSIQCLLLAIIIIDKLKIFYDLKQDQNIVSKIFQITMYHDIGYLYKIKQRFGPGYKSIDIDNTNLGKRICEDISRKLGTIDIKQEVCNISISVQNQITQIIKEEINKIFLEPKDQYNLNEIEDITRYNYPTTSKEHSYYSSIILVKFYNLKRTLNRICYQYSYPVKKGNDESENVFRSVLTAITLHAMELKEENKVSIEDGLLETLLMIVDELQTYGRVPNTEYGKQLLHPKDVEFEFDSNNKLILKNSVNSKEHTTEQIVKELEKRIKEKSLETIFDISCIKKILIRKICKILKIIKV